MGKMCGCNCMSLGGVLVSSGGREGEAVGGDVVVFQKL